MTIIKAAAVQMSPVLYSREGTVDRVVRKIIELGRQSVQFATFPETVVPYYPYFSFVQTPYEIRTGGEFLRLLDQAVTVPSAATKAIGDACKQAGMVVSIGVNERDGGTIYNTQLLFDADGTLIQRRRKISPTYHERLIWGQGDGSGLRAIDSAVGRIGQLACYEHYNPLGAIRLDGRRRADSLGDVSWLLCRRPFRGAYAGQHSPTRSRIRLLRRQRVRLARRRSASPDHEGHRMQHRPNFRWLLYGDCFSGRGDYG